MVTAALLVGLAAPAAADAKGDNATFEGNPCLNFHTDPSLSSGVVVCVGLHSGNVLSSTTGDWVNGLWGWTNCWDYVRYVDEYGYEWLGWASDGFVYTGKNEC